MPAKANLTLINADAIKSARAFEKTLSTVQQELIIAETEGDETIKAMIQSAGYYALERAFTDDMVTLVRRMENHPQGFKVDKTYANDEVRPALLQARIEGLRWSGNEMNVLAGNMYATVNGLSRLVEEHEAVSDFQIIAGDIELIEDSLQGTSAKVEIRAEFKFNKTWQDASSAEKWLDETYACSVQYRDGTRVGDERIIVKVNKGQGYDAMLGKARRKLLARVYEFITAKRIATAEDHHDIGSSVIEGEFTKTSEEKSDGKAPNDTGFPG